MNLNKLFEAQAKLDEHIEQEHPRQNGEDRLAKKILALQSELGELCNCWRGFKFWSYDQEPIIEKRIYKTCPSCNGEYVDGCWMCDHSGQVVDKIINPLLKEFVDCLHFILSIGLELKLTDWKPHFSSVAVHFGGNELISQFDEVFWYASSYKAYREDEKNIWYSSLFSNFLGLGKMLGFTWEQVEQAYLEKNQIKTEEVVLQNTERVKVGDIVEYGTVTGVIVEENSELYFEFRKCDNPKFIGAKDKLELLDVESMRVLGHIDTDPELLEEDSYNYEDVW